MSATVAYDPQRLTGYALDQLAGAFDRVRDPRDWKAPIQAVIPTEDQPLVEKAVLWFTDTVPAFSPVPGVPDRLTVMAPGYRLGESETRNGHLREDSQRILASLDTAAAMADGPRRPVLAHPAAQPRRRFAASDASESASLGW